MRWGPPKQNDELPEFTSGFYYRAQCSNAALQIFTMSTSTDLSLSSRSFAWLQVGVVSFLLLLAVVDLLVAEFSSLGSLRPLRVGAEASLPTWFSVMNLTLAALLACAVAFSERAHSSRLWPYWLSLAALMLLLSLDESVQIHEQFLDQGAALAPGLPQIHSHGWVLFGAIFAVAMALAFAPFLLNLPRPLMVRIVVAGGVFVFGAVGVESFGAVADYYGWLEREDLAYELRRVVEEGCEMFGIVLFNCALYGHCASRGLRLQIGST